jgi:SulP family sulfate permease
VSIGRALGARGGYRIDGNQEFIGQGLSNIAGSFFSGYVATGSFNRSAVNYEAGARTPLAAMLAGLLLMLVVLFVAPLAGYLPKATMAAVLFLVAWGLIDRAEIRHIIRASRRETAVLGVTFFSALFLDLEFAIFAGVLLSLVLYLERTSKPRLVTVAPDARLPKRAFSSSPDTPQCPQLCFLRIDGSLFFGAVPNLETHLARLRRTHPEQRHLAIIADGINFVDLQGAEALAAEARQRRADGGGLYLIHAKQGLREALALYGSLQADDGDHLYQSKEAAIQGVFQQLDRAVCARCDKRIFLECKGVPGSP